MQNFYTIDYLRRGNPKQKLAYSELIELNLIEKLREYTPLLAGTVPIDIDIAGSDLDIVCQCADHEKFTSDLKILFGEMKDFVIYSKLRNGINTTVARFMGKYFIIEIFGQNIPCEEQAAFQHMLIEYQILNEMGERFGNQIRDLKVQGYKTEPAFAKLLALDGDPYIALLEYQW